MSNVKSSGSYSLLAISDFRFSYNFVVSLASVSQSRSLLFWEHLSQLTAQLPGGGVLNQVFDGEAPPGGTNHYPLIQ